MYISDVVWHFVRSTKLQVLALPLSKTVFEVLHTMLSTLQLETDSSSKLRLPFKI